jgi:3-oxoacyl-[acyl-carrier protein] reductase
MQSEARSLAARVALVSGGSGWIGSGIARQLAAAGAKVAVNYFHDDPAADRTVKSIKDAGGVAVAVKGDITDKTAAYNLVDRIQRDIGAVDLLVNNAINSGVPHGPIEEQEWEHYLGHLEFCVKAPLLLLKAVLAGMKAKGFGRVINIGSEAFDLADPRNAQYVSSKGAMLGATRSWANELGAFGITVNSVAPGWIAADRHGFEGTVPTPALASYIDSLPLGRVGTPDDVGATVCFLCSDAAGFITGQRIYVNGGKTLV